MDMDFLEKLSTPASTAAVMVWLHLRLSRIESNQRIVAAAMRVDLKARKTVLDAMSGVIFAFAVGTCAAVSVLLKPNDN